MGRKADRFGKPSKNRSPLFGRQQPPDPFAGADPDADLPFAEEIDEDADLPFAEEIDEDADLPFAEEIADAAAAGEPIPLDWEERKLQEPRRAKNAGQGEYQIPLDWANLGAEADALFLTRELGVPGHNIEGYAWTPARDMDHPSRLWVWFRGSYRVSRGGKLADVKPGVRTRYCYDRVDYSVFTGLRAAGSKGKYLQTQVKDAGYLYHGPF
jgi:hypothetical protein